MTLFRRDRWPVVLPLYDGRRCPECYAIVIGKHGQRGHQSWHERLEDDYDAADVDGSGPGGSRGPEPGVEVVPGVLVGGEPYRPERADGSGYFVGDLEAEE